MTFQPEDALPSTCLGWIGRIHSRQTQGRWPILRLGAAPECTDAAGNQGPTCSGRHGPAPDPIASMLGLLLTGAQALHEN